MVERVFLAGTVLCKYSRLLARGSGHGKKWRPPTEYPSLSRIPPPGDIFLEPPNIRLAGVILAKASQ